MNRISVARDKMGLTQAELATMANISTVTLSRYENSKRSPQYCDLQKIAQALKTSVAYLMGETDDPSPIPTFTRETPPLTANPQPEPEAVAEPAPLTRTPAKIIENIASINGEIAETSGLFTDSEAKTAEMLLRLCIENLETEPAASSEQETAS